MTTLQTKLALKRALDILLSGIAIVFFVPLYFAIAIYIMIRSPGPVLFRQTRVGRNGADFSLLKFRSMHVNTSVIPNAATTRCSDPRVFPGADWIRKYKLDELPQLFNVFYGDMSVIGPRPTVREDYERMSSEQRRRVSVRPGLSGLAQIGGNTSLSWPERIELDLQYIDTLSIWNDVRIIGRTVRLIFSGRADTHPATDDEWS